VVRGIGDGSLPVERFARYVRQDYLFLIEYARLLALGAARAPDLTTMRSFADLAGAILGTAPSPRSSVRTGAQPARCRHATGVTVGRRALPAG
jgi:thiaminase